MRLLKVIPKIFYEDIKHGLDLFVNGLGFQINYQEPNFYIVGREGVTLILVEDAEFAQKDRPEMRIETDDIETLYREVSEKARGMLHPNLNIIKNQSWGLREFAMLDPSGVCVIIQQNAGG